MSPQPPNNSVDWCREQQRAALEHMSHAECDHPQCTPQNNRQWLLDSFAEEIEILYGNQIHSDG
jgi:hypothetical protein